MLHPKVCVITLFMVLAALHHPNIGAYSIVAIGPIGLYLAYAYRGIRGIAAIGLAIV